MLPSKQHNRDAALEQYPAAMAELFSLGSEVKIDYTPNAEALAGYVPDLVRLALDVDLLNLPEDDPSGDAPVHALKILAIQGPAEAAEPLLALLYWDDAMPPMDDLESIYARIGAPAIPHLLAYLEDATHDDLSRSHASDLLIAIAKANPDTRDQIVEALTRFLDRPAANDSADEEALTAFVISDLTDLNATSAYAAIARAFAEDRVDTQILDLDFVEQEFGMKPRWDPENPMMRDEPGVRLVLRCKVCGRERPQIFPRVYYDMATAKDEQKSARYDPLVIPQPVTCPKCGAIDQYELDAMGYGMLTASLLAATDKSMESGLRPDQRIRLISFTTRWGKMHPIEAIERYQQELASARYDSDLHVGLANVYRFLGKLDQAMAEYDHALELDPDKIEAWVSKAQIAADRRDLDESIRCWEMVRAIPMHKDIVSPEHLDFLEAAKDSLELLYEGVFPVSEPPGVVEEPEPMPPSQGRMAPEHRVKVGRNEPCPCGSGKKYKHCHGRKS